MHLADRRDDPPVPPGEKADTQACRKETLRDCRHYIEPSTSTHKIDSKSRSRGVPHLASRGGSFLVGADAEGLGAKPRDHSLS